MLLHCPDIAGMGGRASIKVSGIVAWSFAATAAIIGMIWFGVPIIADQVTELLPLSWEKPLGQAVDGQVRALFGGTECTAPAGIAALGKLVAKLQLAAKLPIRPDPVVLKSSVPNAFALPGGRIFILSDLIGKAGSPDELAGVLAHEFGHVAHRDGLRRLLRDGGTGYLLGLLFGDVTGAGAALVAARTLLNSAYSRGAETASDDFSVMVMRALGRPTAALGDLLSRVAQDTNASLSLFRDHPLTPDRIIRLAGTGSSDSGPALLDPDEWQALRSICR
ncbi:MAG: M48 family metallopeptidase [Acetobacteraceae bacterium]|nr:M48 family metallopeptidase [Acetobacteraceae bacterium]